MISEALKINTTLTKLNLYCDEIWKNEWNNNNEMNVKEREWIKIEMIINIWTDNKVGNEGARMISEALKINTTLTVLNLESDEIWKMNENNNIMKRM